MFWVNIGDGDVLKIKADTLAEVEEKIKQAGEFSPWMINAVVKVGHEKYLEGFPWAKLLKMEVSK